MFKKVMSISLVICLIIISLASCKKDVKTTASNAPKASATIAKIAASANLSTNSISSTAAPVVDTSNVTEYSIELDFKIINQAAGIVFAFVDDTQFMMYQFNSWDYGDNPDKALAEADKKVYFRPHTWIAGAATVVAEKEISNAIKWEDRAKKQHLKITVSAANEINTYINDILIDTYTAENATYGLFGFRQCTDSLTNAEEAAYDNIVITDTASKKVIYQENFDSNVNPFAEGEIKAGLINDTPALDMIITAGVNNVNVLGE